jgi:hypothetical protein
MQVGLAQCMYSFNLCAVCYNVLFAYLIINEYWISEILSALFQFKKWRVDQKEKMILNKKHFLFYLVI